MRECLRGGLPASLRRSETKRTAGISFASRRAQSLPPSLSESGADGKGFAAQGNGNMTPTKKLALSSDSPLKLHVTDEESIPQTMTLRKALMGGTDPLATYMKDLLPSVQKRLLTYLAYPPAGSLIPRSSLALNRHQPLAIQMKPDAPLTTFREAFSFANAKIALGRVGLYEAAGNFSG